MNVTHSLTHTVAHEIKIKINCKLCNVSRIEERIVFTTVPRIDDTIFFLFHTFIKGKTHFLHTQHCLSHFLSIFLLLCLSRVCRRRRWIFFFFVEMKIFAKLALCCTINDQQPAMRFCSESYRSHMPDWLESNFFFIFCGHNSSNTSHSFTHAHFECKHHWLLNRKQQHLRAATHTIAKGTLQESDEWFSRCTFSPIHTHSLDNCVLAFEA